MTEQTKWWVAGSRGIVNYVAVSNILRDHILAPDIVRTGGAKGVDRIAELWAKQQQIKLEETLEPDYKRYRGGAPFVRNTEGVEWADRVLIVWDGISPGSKHVIEECVRLQKEYYLYKFIGEGVMT